MALRFEDVSKFARQNGDVKGWAKHGVVTLLKSEMWIRLSFGRKML